METVLITGATGFIGKNLIEIFNLYNNYKIIAFVQPEDFKGINFLKSKGISYITSDELYSYNYPIDYCIHLASYGVDYAARDVDIMIDVNIKLSAKIVKFCSGRGCKLFINTGSCFEYGSLIANRLIRESDCLKPEDIYAASKVACEDFLKVYCNILNLKFTTIRPFSVFGKYENKKRLVPLIFSAGINNTVLELTGGEQIRDYMDVRDLAESIYLLIVNHQLVKNDEAINICTGNPMRLKDFILKIVDICNFNCNLFKFGVKQYRQNESMYFAGDNSRLLEIIGVKDFTLTNDKIIAVYNSFNISL